MHDGQHGAASKYPLVNTLCGWVIDFFGASGYIWKHEHNLGHHQNTNTSICVSFFFPFFQSFILLHFLVFSLQPST